jgi:LacI family transcriptional regulator
MATSDNGISDKKSSGGATPGPKPVRLKDVAEHLDLSPATVSIVLNRSPVADSIPEATKERVFAAAKELNYRPNFIARSLRSRRTFSVGVLVPEISEGYAANVMRGVESHLMHEGYFYLLASYQSKPDLLEEYLRLLEDRAVEGFILLAAQIDEAPKLPTVVVSGHRRIQGVTNVIVDQDRAADLALTHLTDLGHEQIAFFHGAPANADASYRWEAIQRVAKKMGIDILPALVRETGGANYGEAFYQEGYEQATSLIKSGKSFSALFAFNDISAIGAMRAFFDAGLKVPDDVSIVGFDDIQSASFLNPSLTTVRQPLRAIGERAGQVLLERLGGREALSEVVVEPEFIVRASTGPARA